MAAQMNLGNSLIHVFISQNNWHQGCLSRHSIQRNNLKYRKQVKNFLTITKILIHLHVYYYLTSVGLNRLAFLFYGLWQELGDFQFLLIRCYKILDAL